MKLIDTARLDVRLLSLFAVSAVLTMLTVYLSTYSSLYGIGIHILFVTIGSMLALFAGLLAMIVYFSRENYLFLFLGLGFICAGLIDGYDGIIFAIGRDALYQDISGTWPVSRIFLGGFVLLAVGFFKWIPSVQSLSDVVNTRTQDVQRINKKLILEIRERKQAEKVKREFISTVSHELRTPLTSIMGSLSLIQSGTVDQDSVKLRSLVDIASKNTSRLALLVNDILDIENVSAGMMELHMQPTKVVTLIKEALEANRGYGEEHGVNFVCPDCDKPDRDKELRVHGDKKRLMQALSNLMVNAVKFSPKGEQVEVTATRDGDTVCFSVKDYGPGIPEKFREVIFDKFAQVDSSDTRKKGGTGLGLSISKAIIEQHGGTISFDSEVGTGSTFFFTLPAFE